MVVLVHTCVQQTHLLALHLETLGYIPRLLNALNGLVYFLIIGSSSKAAFNTNAGIEPGPVALNFMILLLQLS